MDEANILGNIEVIELQKIKVAMKHLYSTWNEIGIERDQKIGRVTTAWSHIQRLIQDICDEESAVCEELKDRIKTYTAKISELSKVLCIETTNVVGLTLLKREESLHQEFEALNEMKEKRMKDLKDLQKLEQHYCLLLGMEKHNFTSKTEIPSSEDLKELQQYVNMLTEEHNKRYEKYCQARQEFIMILESTEIVPESSYEKHLSAGKEPHSLSNDTFKTIEEIINKVKNIKTELENKKKNMMDKLLVLWERLNIESEKKTEFLSSHLDYKASTLKVIEEEITRCEEIKRQNIELFINSVREELNELWKKCGASESEKQLFYLYLSTEMTEHVLIAHEQEVERWKKYYEEIKLILNKIEKRNKLWELLMALDSNANDPARFKNRGGNLLKEERERNKLQKTLPTLEEEIFKGIEIYEAETGRKFLYLGEDYRSHIYKQWQERTSHKENIKEKCQHSCTPVKRQPFSTPKSAPCPRYKAYHTPIVKSTPKTAKKQPLFRPKTIKKRDQDILKEVNKNMGEMTPNNDTTYSDFATELNRTLRRSFRSTIVTSKKVGGTRTPHSIKKKHKFIKAANTPDREHKDLTAMRAKSGLPFLM